MTDAAAQLHTPLEAPRTLAERLSWLPNALRWFTRVGGTVLVVLALLVAGWILFVHDPLGGQPIATASISTPAAEPSEATDVAMETGQSLRAAEGTTAGGPRILEVPERQEPPSSNEATTPDDVASTSGPRFDQGGGLVAVANPRLVERFDEQSFVPTLGPAGERAVDMYARPVEAGTIPPGAPRIAVIVSGLGISQTATQSVIDTLPGAMTLSFAPYGNSLERWTSRARAAGHEYLIEVPMEPFDYPNNDPGPHTLLVSNDAQANRERLIWALSRVQTPVGLMNYMGSRFTSEPDLAESVVNEAARRGLMVVDDGRSARSRLTQTVDERRPGLRADVVIDGRPDAASIRNRLLQLEQIARDRGVAVGVASAFPLTIESLADWSENLASKGIVLVPVSSLVRFND